MVIIPNGIDTDHFFPNAEAGNQVRAEWGVVAQERLIGLVGRMDPMKDHITFLRAASLLARKRSDVRFVCVGDESKEMRRQILSLAVSLGIHPKVVWAGPRADMPGVYNALDLLCSSSVSESFPNAIGEALACGVPCVATAVGDCAEIIGPLGVVVPPRDPQALASGMLTLLNGSVPVAPDLLHKHIADRFGVQRLITDTEAMLRCSCNKLEN
jgi:glycosyltransferase involved in cell wall biosynthesis